MKNFDKTEEKMNENLNEESQTAVFTDNDMPEEEQNETDRKDIFWNRLSFMRPVTGNRKIPYAGYP